jgi:NADPH:quinone reductase-like Zn-dependent oxidoreductase
VLVRVAAAGVNYADCVVRMGMYDSAKKYVGWPITPGFEVAGDVVSVGEGATRFKAGDRVVAVTRFGGYASRLVVPEHQVFSLPDSLEFAEAASIPAVYLTAYYALYELCRLRPGMKILVHSAAGGVGSAMVQLARQRGVSVVGVVGAPHKVEPLRALGCDHVIDKSSEDLFRRAREIEPEGYHVVLDANGAETLAGSYEAVRSSGRLVVYGFHTMFSRTGGKPSWLKLGWDFLRTPRFSPFDLCGQNRSVMAFNLSYLFEERELLGEGMRTALGHIERGEAKLSKVTRYPVEKVGEAHRDLESGQTFGKLVLTFGG